MPRDVRREKIVPRWGGAGDILGIGEIKRHFLKVFGCFASNSIHHSARIFGGMDLFELDPGEKAPKGASRVRLNVATDGTVNLSGAALGEHLIDHSATYSSVGEAKIAALAWASQHRIRQLYVER